MLTLFAPDKFQSPIEMLCDLSKAQSVQQAICADIAVIGGGLAGLVLASRLSRNGLRVVVLESGGMTQSDDRHPLNEVVQPEQVYRGAEEGRVRCLGGTSTRWGGAMLPFVPDDLRRHPEGWDIEWPVSLDELAGAFAEIERLFELPEGRFDVGEERLGTPSGRFRFRSAKWPTFRMRNVAHVFRRELAGPALEVILNATVTRFHLDEAGRLAAVVAVSPAGNEVRVEAGYTVIAAGAIESTRLLLLMDAQYGNRIFAPDGVLGCYFYDHLSASAATIAPENRAALIREFGLRFDAHGMRDRRIEPTESLRSELDVPGAFAHVMAQSANENAFAALRAIYRALQRQALPSLSHVPPLVRNLGWLVEAVWWRFARGRLLPPHDAAFELVLVTEQMPHASNRITLSEERRDRNGSPMARIEWRIREPDIEAFRLLQRALVSDWMNSSLRTLGALTPTADEVWHRQMREGGGIYHPGGSTRMGSVRSRAVVDAELRTFAIPNLYVVSTSAFPSGGSANPSFMLMAFALRAADRIAFDLRH